MVLIYQSKNFKVEAVDLPHVDRDEGGAYKNFPKRKISKKTRFGIKTGC